MLNRKQRRDYVKRMNTPQKLENFSNRLNMELKKEYQKIYEEKYNNDLTTAMDTFILSIIFTLHFNEQTHFGTKRILSFMDDLLATVDNFNDGSYNPEEYMEMLRKDGIEVIPSQVRKRKDK